MSNLKWNKQTERNANPRGASNGFPAASATTPATETELDAFRYRGTPIRRTAPPTSAHQSPTLDSGHNLTPGSGEHLECIKAIGETVRQTSAWVAPLRHEIARVVAQKYLVDRLLVGLVTNGHILLDGVPGLAKTLSLKTLAAAAQLKFHPQQFTPDMMTADVVGTLSYDLREGAFHAKHGPLFSNLILADELNCAPARVQSAVLDAMREGHVTLGDDTIALPKPFLVMATQNPLQREGTRPLSEAQVDRFMLNVIVDHPSRAEERAILEVMASSEPDLSVQPVASGLDVLDARRVVNSVYVDDMIKDYIVDVVWATREPKRYGMDINRYIRHGASSRGTIALTMAAKAWAYLNGRGCVTPQDVKAFAPDALRHRLAVSYEAEADNISSEDIINKILETLPVP